MGIWVCLETVGNVGCALLGVGLHEKNSALCTLTLLVTSTNIVVTLASHTIRKAIGVIAKLFVYQYHTTGLYWSTGLETELQRVYRTTL